MSIERDTPSHEGRVRASSDGMKIDEYSLQQSRHISTTWLPHRQTRESESHHTNHVKYERTIFFPFCVFFGNKLSWPHQSATGCCCRSGALLTDIFCVVWISDSTQHTHQLSAHSRERLFESDFFFVWNENYCLSHASVKHDVFDCDCSAEAWFD